MSNTNVSRKQYVIGYKHDDLLHSTVKREEYLPAGLLKFVDVVQGADLLPVLPIKAQTERRPSMTQEYAVITRRAAARRIVQHLKATKYHNHDEFSLIEVGVFNRTVRPVSHWNVMRQWRTVDGRGKPLGKWSAPTEWDTGNATREEARSIAAARLEEHQKPGRLLSTERVKFTVVPVYADEVNA